MWNKRFNIVIYCLLPLYLATKAICPLWSLSDFLNNRVTNHCVVFRMMAFVSAKSR